RSKPPAPTEPDSDRVVIGKPTASGGTYKWFFLPGTIAEVTGRSGEQVRIRLDRDLSVWVDASEVRELPIGTPAPTRIAGNARVVARSSEVSDLVIPMAERPPFIVHEGTESLTLELFGTTANTDILNLASADSIVRRVTWEPVGEGRARYVVALREAPFGYLVRWERGALVLRLRRAPRIADPKRPLQGLTIAVDAGHPPAGSTGPTGLYEPVATLPIAQRLKAILESRGATVVMPRTTAAPLGLPDRPELARRANAHAFVSIHLNALPDGINPYTAHGTGTYYFNPRAEPFAREVQRGMVRHMGLRDLGINYDNLAVLRPTWMPAILCEGAFVMLPEQEALLRMPEFQQAYAEGVAEGIERYFAGFVRR
ncbi:MAG: N-acetylmuramoyl-L-alanine amidase, partial [Chloroflexia bacterium]